MTILGQPHWVLLTPSDARLRLGPSGPFFIAIKMKQKGLGSTLKHSKYIALGLVVLASLWILTADVKSREEISEDEVDSASANQAVIVQTRISHAQTIAKTLTLTGHVEPYRSVTLKAETAGQVVSTPAERSQRVNKNEVIVELAMNDREARLKQAEAALRQAKSDWQANLKLQQKGLHAKSSVLNYATQVAQAEALITQVQQEIQQTRIKAPFAGVLDQRSVVLGDFIDRADTVAVLVDDSRVLIHVQVPQQALASVQPNQQAQVRLVTNEVLTGTVAYIAHLPEPETRSFKVEIQVPNPQQKRWLGLSATVSLPLAQQSAHLVSPALLNLDYQGALYVKALADDQKVVAYKVTIVRHESAGFWVSGLPNTVRLITDGQGFYQAGDLLDAHTVKAQELVLTQQESQQ